MVNKRKKRIVEVYFILYLAALVLIIPGKDNGHKGHEVDKPRQRFFQLPFSLKPEKNSLNAIVKLDSIGMTILSMDSVNTIFYTGHVKDIKFDVTIEDRNTRQVLTLDKRNEVETDFFRYSGDQTTQSLKFYWDPPLYDRKSKTYIVKVKAQAVSTDSESLGLIVEDIVQFSLNLNYITDFNTNLLIASDAIDTNTLSDNGNELVESRTALLSGTNLFLSPREEIIKSIAYSQWENEITIFGLDPKFDLRRQPEIKITRQPDNRIGGSAKVTGFTESGIVIKGETPGFGVMTVSVSLIRHADGKEVIREFKVQPQLMEEPRFEQVLYPDMKYTFEPRLPVLSGQKVYSALKSSDGKIYASSETGGIFTYTPTMSDTGKVLYFERFVDNNLIGQKHTVRVSMFPQPEIVRIAEIDKNTFRIFTNSYGTFKGRENYISRIEIIQGSVKVREIIGAQKNEEGTFTYKQVFEITPTGKSTDVSFKVQAVSVNGQKSDVMSHQ
jgi:hypothetical protein